MLDLKHFRRKIQQFRTKVKKSNLSFLLNPIMVEALNRIQVFIMIKCYHLKMFFRDFLFRCKILFYKTQMQVFLLILPPQYPKCFFIVLQYFWHFCWFGQPWVLSARMIVAKAATISRIKTILISAFSWFPCLQTPQYF